MQDIDIVEENAVLKTRGRKAAIALLALIALLSGAVLISILLSYQDPEHLILCAMLFATTTFFVLKASQDCMSSVPRNHGEFTENFSKITEKPLDM